jgi:hypothetical protein
MMLKMKRVEYGKFSLLLREVSLPKLPNPVTNLGFYQLDLFFWSLNTKDFELTRQADWFQSSLSPSVFIQYIFIVLFLQAA